VQKIIIIIIIIIELLKFKVHDIFGETPRPDGKISTTPLVQKKKALVKIKRNNRN
jgi:hypothetical protein